MLDSQILNTFRDLLEQAQNSGELEPTSMNLATVDVEGRPHSRIVLLKQVDERGVRFYTNYDSAKGREIDANSAVALCFHWQLLGDGKPISLRVWPAGRTGNSLHTVHLSLSIRYEIPMYFRIIVCLGSSSSYESGVRALRDLS